MFAVHRIEKFKGNLYGLQIETQRKAEDHFKNGREFPDSEIRWSDTDRNVILRSCQSWDKELNKRYKEAGVKVKKDSVKMIGAIYTASKEFFNRNDDGSWPFDEHLKSFVKDSLKFHIDEYCGGDQSQVISCVVHLDEGCPHLEVYSSCLYRDKDDRLHLSAKSILGDRTEFHKRQDRFYEVVGKPRGLERGKVRDPGEKVKHKKTADYHAEQRAIKAAQQEQLLAAQRAEKERLEKSLANIEKTVSARSEELQELQKAVQKNERAKRALDARIADICNQYQDQMENDLMKKFIEYGKAFNESGDPVRCSEAFERFKQREISRMLEQQRDQDNSFLQDQGWVDREM